MRNTYVVDMRMPMRPRLACAGSCGRLLGRTRNKVAQTYGRCKRQCVVGAEHPSAVLGLGGILTGRPQQRWVVVGVVYDVRASRFTHTSPAHGSDEELPVLLVRAIHNALHAKISPGRTIGSGGTVGRRRGLLLLMLVNALQVGGGARAARPGMPPP